MTGFIKCVSFQGNHSRRKGQWVEEMFLWVMLSQTCTNPKMNPFRFHWYLIFFPYSPIFHGDNDVKMSALLWKGRTFILMWSQVLYLIGGLQAKILASCAHILCSLFFTTQIRFELHNCVWDNQLLAAWQFVKHAGCPGSQCTGSLISVFRALARWF